jgi:hypothetical protein
VRLQRVFDVLVIALHIVICEFDSKFCIYAKLTLIKVNKYLISVKKYKPNAISVFLLLRLQS